VQFPVTHDYTNRPRESPDGFYRTVFGPSIPHTGVTYCRCNQCQSLALRRITCVRAPAVENAFEYELRFRQAQRDWIDSVRHILVKWIFDGDCKDYVDAFHAMVDHAGDPHPKRELRIQAREELLNTMGAADRLWLKRVLYKLKTEEFGKIGKLARLVGDLGTPASLQGFKVTELVKKMMACQPIEWEGLTCQVVIDPKPETLINVFENLINPPGRGYFVLYSDDSCLSLSIGGRVRHFNLDIASCDTSHTEKLFRLLCEIVPPNMREDMEVLVEQCKLPIEVRDQNDRSRRVILEPNEATLYSGSTLTTIINNLANVLIFLSIATANIQTPDDVRIAAARAGYVVTGTSESDECDTYHKIQFLKHSPVYDTQGRLRALKNPGVFLRSLGHCKRDLPGSGSILERAKDFNCGYIQGSYPCTRINFVEELRAKFANRNLSEQMNCFVEDHLPFHKASRDDEPWSVSDGEWAQRYNLENWEVEELNVFCRYAGLEQEIVCTAVDKILKADYGLSVLG